MQTSRHTVHTSKIDKIWPWLLVFPCKSNYLFQYLVWEIVQYRHWLIAWVKIILSIDANFLLWHILLRMLTLTLSGRVSNSLTLSTRINIAILLPWSLRSKKSRIRLCDRHRLRNFLLNVSSPSVCKVHMVHDTAVARNGKITSISDCWTSGGCARVQNIVLRRLKVEEGLLHSSGWLGESGSIL